MAEVTEIGAARHARQYDGLVCSCGSSWWRVAVTLETGGRVTGMTTSARCDDCDLEAPVKLECPFP